MCKTLNAKKSQMACEQEKSRSECCTLPSWGPACLPGLLQRVKSRHRKRKEEEKPKHVGCEMWRIWGVQEESSLWVSKGRETRQKYSKKVSLCYEKDPLNILQRIMVKNNMPLPFSLFPNATLQRHRDMRHHYLYLNYK